MESYADDKKQIGTLLRGARNNAGLTLQNVADHLGITKAAVGHWETGKNIPDLFQLKRLAKLYKQPLDALVWQDALSFEAMQFAAEFEGLTETQRRTLRAIWVAYITNGNPAAPLPTAPRFTAPT